MSIPKLKPGTLLTIRQCSDCGFIEGGQVSSCCPGCGSKGIPRVVRVRVEKQMEKAQ